MGTGFMTTNNWVIYFIEYLGYMTLNILPVVLNA